MKWLGVSVPKWMENELVHSSDTLAQSIKLSKNVFEELLEFAAQKKHTYRLQRRERFCKKRRNRRIIRADE